MKTILFVDDDQNILKTVNFYFKNKYNILLAESVTSALDILNTSEVDLIVSDYGMIGGTGLDFKKILNEKKLEIPFIVISGEINKETSIKFANLDVDQIMEKPIVLSELETIIVKLLALQENKKEEKKLCFIGKNAGQIIHDINNSLGIILLSSDVGEKSLPETAEFTLSRKLFSKTQKACNNIVEIISKYKALANSKEIVFNSFSLSEIQDHLNNEMKNYCSAHSIDYNFTKINSVSRINTDLTLLTQVFLNLCSNSKDSFLESKHNNPKIDVIVEENTKNIYFKFLDNGEGIPDKIKENLFQEKNSSKGSLGTGMGLFYCKKIIDLHIGRIYLDKSNNSVTEFHIVLNKQNNL